MKIQKKKMRPFAIIACLLIGGVGIYTNSAKASDYDSWPELTLSTTGGTIVSSGNYKITNNITINASAGTSGIIIDGNVNLYIPSGKTITTKGGNGGAADYSFEANEVGGAGIEIPDTATLQLFGDGTINATGGKGGAPGNGYGGGAGNSYDQPTALDGRGGAGGVGAGAGIGGKGGHANNAAMPMGKLFVHDQMKVNSTGGELPIYNIYIASGGLSYNDYSWMQVRNGGGAGGGGGTGYNGANIGAGGAGGGTGGTGANMGSVAMNKPELVGNGGGGGGAGAYGGKGGLKTGVGSSGEDGTSTQPGAGGSAGSSNVPKATNGNPTDRSALGGSVYVSRTATVTSSLPQKVNTILYGTGATSNVLEEIVLEPAQTGVTITSTGATNTGGVAGQTLPILSGVPVADHHTFQGYYSQASGQGTKYINADGTATTTTWNNTDTKLFAYWISKDYSITYNLDGGTEPGNPTTYTVESENIILKAPTKANHIFKGWKKDGSETVESSVTIPKGSAGNVSYSAVWLQEYTITYNLDGGTEPGNPTIYTTESEDITLVAPTKASYIFKGWKLDGSDTLIPSVTIPKGSSGDVTYSAVWAATYTVSFDSQGGSNVNDVFVEQNNILIKPSNPTRKDYKFEGWYKEANCLTAWNYSDPVNSNMTLYALWVLDPKTETENIDINTTDTSKDQEGTIYGSLSGSVLTQLKAEVPIKLDFAVAPDSDIVGTDAPSKANKFFVGDYKIKVASDSEAGLEVNGVQITPIGGWKIDTATNIEQIILDKTGVNQDLSKQKTISLSMAGKELKTGINTFAKDEFTIAVSDAKSLQLKGTAGRVWLDAGIQANPESAFKIIYIVSQKK